MADNEQYDLAVIGGGINGVGIARDASGRGLRVLLCEQHDLAAHTSSASTKLVHGGLRYLEYYEFRLVREALRERERLLRLAPHIIWPLRFVLPHDRHQRPVWMIRTGLFLYDHLGGRRRLPGSTGVNLRRHPVGRPLDPSFSSGFMYSDCWVQDARLVVLNAMDARARGSDIRVRTRCERAERGDRDWTLQLRDPGGRLETARARAVVNAAGPWARRLFDSVLHKTAPADVRLIKGSHIVVPRIFDHDCAYIFQNSDNRVVFAIPYERDYTLIGTTDEEYSGNPGEARISAQEISYLCSAVSRYFRTDVVPDDVVWSFSGVRPLYDDHNDNASSVTRDYVLELDAEGGRPPLLSVFGGKLTTYRSLSEQAMKKLKPIMGFKGGDWTGAGDPLPGGDIEDLDFNRYLGQFRRRYNWLPDQLAWRLVRDYGTCANRIVEHAQKLEDLGTRFGADLHVAEVNYLIQEEWASTAEDILWRRSKLGLRFAGDEVAALDAWLGQRKAA